ncbi:MAG: LacI family DNA-binding transcriptional regulator [Saprospiraceae bacterium]|nr:LacI family DNA-binding transcriptional regulator [Saprospiraceae bacterium]
MKRSTLKDIAKLTGLSVSGVSRALKGHPDIAPETKERVKEVAKALNYHPNPNAQFLHSKSSKIIAVILPEVNTFFFPEILQGISEVVEQHGYFLLFLQSDNKFQKEKDLIEYCIQMFVDGVLISLSAETTSLDHLLKLKEMDAAVVLIDRVLSNDSIPYLTIDDAEASRKAVDHLISKGHTNILGIFDDGRLSMTNLRASGFRQAHEQNGLHCGENRILIVNGDVEIEEQIIQLIDENAELTAIFTMSDKLMVKAYHAINSLGFKMPDDIALISISDGKAPYYLYPGISHVRHSGEEVGTSAATLLFRMLSDEKNLEGFHQIETKLVELGSV